MIRRDASGRIEWIYEAIAAALVPTQGTETQGTETYLHLYAGLCILIVFYRVSITDVRRFDASRVLRLIVISICHEF